MQIDSDTIKRHVSIIREHLQDIQAGLENGASKYYFREEARCIINQAEFIIEEASEQSEDEDFEG